MRVIIAPEFYQQMLDTPYHTPDCYVRAGEYLHHMYIEGVKYIIAPAVLDCLDHATQVGDEEAIKHLTLHPPPVRDAARRGRADGQPGRRHPARRPAADRRGSRAR